MCDAYEMWRANERRKERWLKKRPVCCYCEEHIQDDFFFEINGEAICEECLKDNFRKSVEDYIE